MSWDLLGLSWACFGLVLGLFLACSGVVSGLFWISTGVVLGFFWACSGDVLACSSANLRHPKPGHPEKENFLSFSLLLAAPGAPSCSWRSGLLLAAPGCSCRPWLLLAAPGCSWLLLALLAFLAAPGCSWLLLAAPGELLQLVYHDPRKASKWRPSLPAIRRKKGC